jgi:hypothetical protein
MNIMVALFDLVEQRLREAARAPTVREKPNVGADRRRGSDAIRSPSMRVSRRVCSSTAA